MNNYYTSTIPLAIAEKLKEKGMPMNVWKGLRQGISFLSVMEDSKYDWLDKELENEPSKVERRYAIPSYAEVFDWFMEKEIYIRIIPFREVKGVWAWSWFINRLTQPSINSDNYWMDWTLAADSAIEKALTLI